MIILLMFVVLLRDRSIKEKLAITIFASEKLFCKLSFILIEDNFYRPTGMFYYGSMAIMDLITIMLIYKLVVPTNLSVDLQKICMISMILNGSAWICWENYIKHAEIYGYSYVILYFVALILMIKKDNMDDRDIRRRLRNYILSVSNR